MDENRLTETIKSIAQTISDYYINESTAKVVSSELIKFISTDKWKKALQLNSPERLLRHINCMISAETDDGHFYITLEGPSYGVRQDSGIDRYTPNYIHIQSFVSSRYEHVRAAYIRFFNQVSSPLLIDLRDNFGGDPETAYFILCHLFPDDVPMFEYTTRTTTPVLFKSATEIPFYNTLNHVRKFNGIVNVLVNNWTASAAELLAHTIQQRGRGKIYGTKTSGNAHLELSTKFNEFILHLPCARLLDPDTHLDWEGVGVDPDYSVITKEYIRLIYHDLVANLITPGNSH